LPHSLELKPILQPMWQGIHSQAS